MKKLIILALALSPMLAMASSTHNTPVKASLIYNRGVQADTAKIDLKDAEKNVGNVVAIEAKVASARVFSSTALLNVGGEYPNQLLTVVLKGEAIKLYKEGTKPTIKATGKIALRNGKPEMVITDPKDIKITE